ncbi:MAG: hypothetical protein P8P74_17385 [Crocinitomicaceae bacterium]|nr:hypothetical protein [Crocinitomicaceae bacterium]
MKYLLTAFAFSFCLSGMAATEFTSEKASFSTETVVFDGGKKKKRRVKRVKAKRKRRCQRAARRNFAG